MRSKTVKGKNLMGLVHKLKSFGRLRKRRNKK